MPNGGREVGDDIYFHSSGGALKIDPAGVILTRASQIIMIHESRYHLILFYRFSTAAEGATDVTIVVVRRVDVRSTEGQEVGVGRRYSSTRPPVAVATDITQLTIV